MSIPTSQEIPGILNPDKLDDWAQRLQEFLRTNLQTFAWPESRITLPNGNSQNVNVKGGCVVHIVGPTGAFGIGGFGGGTPGRQLIVHNASSGAMTIRESDIGSAVGNRIRTFSGNLALTTVTLIWDSFSKTWLVIGV